FLLTTAAALLLPSEFQSEAKLKVQLGRESVAIDPTATIGAASLPMQDRSNELNSELELLNSRTVAEAVVRELSAERLGQPQDADESVAVAKAADKLRSDVATAVVPGTSNLTIAFASGDPELARDVVASYVDQFRKVRQEVYRNASGTDFFAQQRESGERELAEIKAQLQAFKDESGVADVEVQRQILLTRIGDLESSIDTTRAEQAASIALAERLEARVAEMPEQVISASKTGAPNSSIESLRTRLAELRLEERDLAARYVETSIVVQNARKQVQEAERLLAEAENAAETTVSVNPVREQLALRIETERADADAKSAKLNRLVGDLAEARGGLARINEAQITIDELERRAAITEESVREYASRFNIARFDQEVDKADISNIAVVTAANLPVKPSGPNRPILLIAGFIMATLAAGGVAFAADAIDHDVARPDDLLALGEPAAPLADACVSIPKLKSGQAVAKGTVDYFDDVVQSVGLLFGTAGRRGTDVAAGTRRGARGFFAASRYILFAALRGTTTGIGRSAIWIGNKVVTVVTLPFGKTRTKAAPTLTPALSPAGQFDGGLSMEEDDEEFTDRPAGLLLDEDELQDEDEITTSEPLAAPQRRVGRSVRLIAWAIARDAAAWRRRDERPNLQLARRGHRSAASTAVWRSARGLAEQIILEREAAGHSGRLPQTAAIIAARAGAGTSTVALHLAGVFAERVLEETERREGDIADKEPALVLRPLLDATETFETDDDGNPVLSDVKETAVPGLSEATINVTRTAELRKAIDVARRSYRHVVLDLPPVFDDVDLTGRDIGQGLGDESGPRLAALAEVTVLVMEADALRREAAGRAVERLQRAGADVAVAVLNKRNYPVPGWLYRRA
ncbi:MAG: hypothetical protein AAF561_09440, partial [Planctomycetota bacterium]